MPHAITALLFFCLATHAHAVLIREETPPGYHVLHDQSTGLTWLSFANTAWAGSVHLESLMEPGGPLSNFRYATASEVLALVRDEYNITINWHAITRENMRRFLTDFWWIPPDAEHRSISGYFEPNPGAGFIFAAQFILFPPGAGAYFDFQAVNYPVPSGREAGTFLVMQPTPEPSTFVLLISGLMLLRVLFVLQRKRGILIMKE